MLLIIILVIYLKIFFSEFFQWGNHPRLPCDNNSLVNFKCDDDSYSSSFARFNFDNEREHPFNPIFLTLDNTYVLPNSSEHDFSSCHEVPIVVFPIITNSLCGVVI